MGLLVTSTACRGLLEQACCFTVPSPPILNVDVASAIKSRGAGVGREYKMTGAPSHDARGKGILREGWRRVAGASLRRRDHQVN